MSPQNISTNRFKVVFSFICLLNVLSYGQEILDQVNNPDWNNGATNIVPANKVTQVFVPSLPKLTSVEVALKTGNFGRGGDLVTLRLLRDNGEEIASVSANIPEGFDGFWRFNFANGGLNVTSGQPYKLLVFDTGKNVFWWKYNSGNPYTPGQAYFYGSPFSNNDFFFKTYGQSTLPSFTLSVTPTPVNITNGESQNLNVAIQRQGGFNSIVTVSILNLPSGMNANPPSQNVSGNSAKITLSSISANPGQYSSTISGVSGNLTASKILSIKIATPPSPRISTINPNIQQKGNNITITGINFESSFLNNTVKIGKISVIPTSGSSTSLTVQIPQQAQYGENEIMVISGGKLSNTYTLTVARESGNFEEITNDIVSQRFTRTCPSGLVRLDICSPNCSGYPTGSYVATFRRTSDNLKIGSEMIFYKDNPRVGNLGGAGFSQCNLGVALDGNATIYIPQLMAFLFTDLETGKSFQANPYGFNWVTPPQSETGVYPGSYSPRIFRSPDGTIIMVITPANQGPSLLTAGFLDKAKDGRIIRSIGINTIDGNITANVTQNNQIQFKFGSNPSTSFLIQ